MREHMVWLPAKQKCSKAARVKGEGLQSPCGFFVLGPGHRGMQREEPLGR